MQPRVLPSERDQAYSQSHSEAGVPTPTIGSQILDFVERHHLFVQLIPFLLVILVLVLGAVNQDVADSLRFVGDLPDLR